VIVSFVILGGILFTFIASLAGYTVAKVCSLDVLSGWRIAVIIAEIFDKVWSTVAHCNTLQLSILYYDGIARMWTDKIS